MTLLDLIQGLFLGLIEGLTEFIPVSSTAHILLVGHFIGFNSPGKTFEVVIQLGAILAILLVYSARLIDIALRLPSDPTARRFVLAILLAFLPAAFIGAGLHSFIKNTLFNSLGLICVTLIAGGIVLLFIDRLDLKPRYTEATDYPLSLAFKIGLCQCLAMIPGMSRSGATIVGAMLMGADKRSAAEFSFFLAMPTMAGAFTYDLIKNWKSLAIDDGLTILVGFVAAFCAGLLVVRSLLDFISRHGFFPFAIWRIIIGTAGLIGLFLVG